MITAICGTPGVGKTSLLTAMVAEHYTKQRQTIYKKCTEYIDEFNKSRQNPLEYPERIPQFANYEVKFYIAYNEYYKPYWINDYRFGLPGGRQGKYEVQYIPPGSYLYLTEIERILDNRKTATLPQWVSRAFQIHRQYHLEIFLDTQRAFGIDLKIRDIAGQFLHVLSQEHKKDDLGNITATTWTCLMFEKTYDYDAYLTSGNTRGSKKIQYTYMGDIYKAYDSFSLGAEFLPPDEKRAGFNMLEYLGAEQVKELRKKNKEEYIFYDNLEPEGYRKEFSKK